MEITTSIIIVNWNSGDHLRHNLESLLENNVVSNLEVIVVDNASSDGSMEKLPREKLIRSVKKTDNTGFAAAANEGARMASGRLLLFMNPDIRHTRDNIDRLLRCFEETPHAAGGCGLLVGEERCPQKGFQLRRLFGPMWALRELFCPPSIRNASPAMQRRFYLDQDWSRPFPVEQPAAACLLMRKTVFDKIDGFDERFYPAWFEDVDLAFRLSRIGAELWFWPDAVFVHHGGYSAETLGREKFLMAYWSNMCRYLEKHFPVFGAIFRRLLPIGFGMRRLAASGNDEERRAWRRVGAEIRKQQGKG